MKKVQTTLEELIFMIGEFYIENQKLLQTNVSLMNRMNELQKEQNKKKVEGEDL